MNFTLVVGGESGDGGYLLESTALHELGHTFGLHHNPDQNTIMFAAYTGKVNFFVRIWNT